MEKQLSRAERRGTAYKVASQKARVNGQSVNRTNKDSKRGVVGLPNGKTAAKKAKVD